MDLIVEPSNKVSGKVKPAPSKFYTQFATTIALLAEGKSSIKSPLLVDDTRSLVKAIESLGATTKRSKKSWSIWGDGIPLNPSGQVIDAKKSMRGLSLLTSLTALTSRVMIVTGKQQVRSRPIPSLLQTLRKLGIDVHSTKSDESPPLVTFESEIKGGKISLNKNTDPYFLPALLLLAPYAAEKVELKLIPKFKNHITKMAVEIMKESGVDVSTTERRLRVPKTEYQPLKIKPPLDIFSTFPYLVGAIITKSKLRISKISKSRNVEEFTALLEKMGIKLEKTSRSVKIPPNQEIKGRRYSLEKFPEVTPFAAVLACFAKGKTRIINIKKARNMKSDRVSTIANELQKMNVDTEEKENELIIEGPAELKGAEVNGWKDDAIVAALSAAGLIADEKTIVKNRAETLRESYPKFVSTFQNLGAKTSYRS